MVNHSVARAHRRRHGTNAAISGGCGYSILKEVALQGGDVYAAGICDDGDAGQNAGCVWNNGVKTELLRYAAGMKDEKKGYCTVHITGQPTALALLGVEPYLAGAFGPHETIACIWVRGEKT